MKRFVLVLVCVLEASCLLSAQRLPEIAVPTNYKLSFTPDFTKDNFAGDETISINVLKPTSEIVLNAVDIDFHDVTVTAAGNTQKATVKPDKEKEMVTLAFDQAIQPGQASIHVTYTGILNNELRGFYLGKDEQGRKYAVTQFESTDARRAFPSFDEPAYKATFDITVVADKGMAAISNAKIASDKPGPGDDKHTVRFETSPKMSSYLAAIVVGHFDYVEGSADGIPIRVWSTPGKKNLSSFALDAAEHIMKYYNKYFSIKYPYGKLDLVGLPDFAAGAMENTGCITFRDVILLVDENHSSIPLRKEVADVIAHEMAHMWFGDLVTMQWWDDIWLNEGFATWMSSKPVQAWKPEWHPELDNVRDAAHSLYLDSLENTRPIHQPAETPAQILELFDGIAYGKAAAVLRMVEAYLGPEDFRAGVNAYIKQHEYANATATDFWGALAKVSKKPVDKVMPTFVEQPGAPMVSVSSKCADGKAAVTLSQQRYFFDRDRFDKGSDELWMVPVCMKQPGSNGAKGNEKCELLTKRQEQFTLSSCSSWVLANAGATGYYRSGYAPDALAAMSNVVEKDLTPAERIMLLADTWSSVRVGREPIGGYLTLGDGLQHDQNVAVMRELLGELQDISDYVVTDNDRDAFQHWVRNLLAPTAKELGWTPKPSDTPDQRTLRARVLFALGYTGRDPDTLAEARKLAEQALDNPEAVDATMMGTVFHLAAINNDSAFYDKIVEHMKAAKTPEQYYTYFGTLSDFTDPKLLQRTLDLSVTPEIRTQDKLGLIAQVMENPEGGAEAWEFSKAHWKEIEAVGGGYTSGEVVEATGNLCEASLRDDVKTFFEDHKVPSAERTLKQSMERMQYCIDLKSRQSAPLASWLQQHGGSSAAGN